MPRSSPSLSSPSLSSPSLSSPSPSRRLSAAGALPGLAEVPKWVPHGAGLHLEDMVVDEDGIAVVVAPRPASAPCPACGHRSVTVHSRYQRTIADLPWGTAPVAIHVRSRRFRCRQVACPRRIFCERLPQVALVSGRQTHCLRVTQQCIGFALGGRPGARLAARLRVNTSRTTLLRLVRAAPEPATATGMAAPRVLGVDDWAKRKGRTYGTILVDLEHRCPVDLLPDRTAETLATWLQQHPGAEVISRDRAGAYAEGARQGAPDSVQVADRWHLLANLRAAVERLLTRHQAALAAVNGAAVTGLAGDVVTTTAAAGDHECLPGERAGTPAGWRRQREVELQQARRTRRIARYDGVIARHAQGMSLRAIADDLELNRATVRRFVQAARAGGFPERRPRASRSTQLTAFDAYLRDRWAAGCHNALALWRELHARGFRGGKSSVRDHVQPWRASVPAPARTRTRRHRGEGAGATGGGATGGGAAATNTTTAHAASSVRDATWLLLRRPAELTAEELDLISALSRQCPEVGVAHGLVQDFASLVRERDHWKEERGALASWVRVATASGIPELGSFAAGLRRDWAAVQSALTSPWSNGQTEGQVNRLKMLKRQMFGRATFDLLRKRVLARL